MLLLRRFLPPGMFSFSPPMAVLSLQGPFSSHLLWATFIHVRVPSTPGPCPESSGFSCSLSFCLYKGIGYFSQAQPTTHLTQPGHTLVSAPGCSISPGPQPQHLAANHPSMSTFMLRCGKPGILHKLRRASPYPNEPAAALLETLLCQGTTDLVPFAAPLGLPALPNPLLLAAQASDLLPPSPSSMLRP